MTIALRADASRAVVVLDGVDRVAFNEDGSMELLTPAAGTPTGNDVPTAGQLPFTKEYVSAQRTITSAGLLTLPHGLGATPKRVELNLVCAVAEHGWSVGDMVFSVSPHQADSSAARSNAVYADSTNVYVRFTSAPNCFTLANKSTGTNSALTNANWRLVVRAWA